MIKKLLFYAGLVALLPSVLSAQNFFEPVRFGTGQAPFGGSREDTFNAAAATFRMAQGFTAPVSCTLDQWCGYVSAKTGTLGATAGVVAIYSESSAIPNSSLSSGTFDPGTTGFKCSTISQAITSGTQYFFNITNAQGTPASNNFALRNGGENSLAMAGNSHGNGTGSSGAMMMTSTNNGSSWGAGAGYRGASAWFRAHCSSGTYFGFPAILDDNPDNVVDSNDRVYNARRVGNSFQIAAGPSQNLRCVEFLFGKNGTPSAAMKYELYTGTTLTASTATAGSVGMITGRQFVPLCFSSAQVLTPGTTYRLVMTEGDAGGGSTAASFTPWRFDFDSTAASKALKPLNGTITKTICSSSCSGGSWTDTDTSYYLMNYSLDPGNEFVAASSGGNASKINRGIN